MENFLTFLSNNYIYFLIAAGVLFFALIGFLFDLKKSKEGKENSEVIPDVTTIPEDINLDAVVSENVNINNQNSEVEEFNPAPPMPQEDVFQSTPVNNEPLEVNNTPVYTETVQSQEIPVQTQEPIQNIETANSNDQINQ